MSWFSARRRVVCLVRRHRWGVFETAGRTAIVVCRRCLVGASEVPLVPLARPAAAPALRAAEDPMGVALGLLSATFQADPLLERYVLDAVRCPEVLVAVVRVALEMSGPAPADCLASLRAASLRLQLQELGPR